MNEPSEKVPLIKSIADVSSSASKHMQPVVDNLSAMIDRIPSDFVEAFMWSMQASSDDLRDCWETLAKRGWFPHPSMFIGTNQIAKIAGQYPDIVDEAFMNQFRKRLGDIEKELVELYPRRSHLLRDAFDAHRRGQYSLAVLMFLNQADGIWYDEHSNSVFRAQDRIDTYKGQNVPQVIGDILSSYIGLLSRPLPIWLNEVDRGKEFHDFNRHLVTHGVSVDYGTEKNSLKLVSFLSWLSILLENMKSNSKT